MAKPSLELLLKSIADGETEPVYLVSGDLVVAEPQGSKLAAALAESAGCTALERRRPAGLGTILQDLRTFSLFESGKVILAVDSAIFADRRAAADLIDQAEDALPVDGELDDAGREGASRLLQALRVFGLDLKAEPAEVVGSLPKWALEGGRRRKKRKGRNRTAKQITTLRDGLSKLLEAARAAGLEGHAEGDLAELGEIMDKGLPDGHALVLAEHAVETDHPVVVALAAKGALLTAGRVSAGRGGEWQGLRTLTDQLAAETSVPIAADAAAELARRTLRKTGGWGKQGIDADSTARFAGEYRKLASQAGGGRHPGGGQARRHPGGGPTKQISRKLVVESVEDRGEEDVWQILDAVGGGRGGEAVARYQRLLDAADDVISARLSFFGLLAGFCRQLTAVAGVAKLRRIPSGVSNFNRFKTRWAEELKADLEDGKNPLSGLHPFRLHRAYLAASRMDRELLTRLPALVFETETQIKGESSEPDVAITQLMARMTAAVD